MIRILRDLLRCTRATAAVEAAIFSPFFLLLTLGITDLGTGMFVRMQVNAATQAGAIYALANSAAGSTCENLTSACLTAINSAMNQASGNASFCTGSVCNASIGGCADGAPKCVTVTANFQSTPILPDAVYSWAASSTISSSTTIRFPPTPAAGT